jgi:hypothetical protein
MKSGISGITNATLSASSSSGINSRNTTTESKTSECAFTQKGKNNNKSKKAHKSSMPGPLPRFIFPEIQG